MRNAGKCNPAGRQLFFLWSQSVCAKTLNQPRNGKRFAQSSNAGSGYDGYGLGPLVAKF